MTINRREKPVEALMAEVSKMKRLGVQLKQCFTGFFYNKTGRAAPGPCLLRQIREHPKDYWDALGDRITEREQADSQPCLPLSHQSPTLCLPYLHFPPAPGPKPLPTPPPLHTLSGLLGAQMNPPFIPISASHTRATHSRGDM